MIATELRASPGESGDGGDGDFIILVILWIRFACRRFGAGNEHRIADAKVLLPPPPQLESRLPPLSTKILPAAATFR